MSGSSEVNLKQTLRKMEYPACAKEALNKLVDLICVRVTNIKHMDLALDLMSEFIFYEVDRRGNKRPQPVSPIVELQLLEILFKYLNGIPNETTRNTVFLNLFSPTTAASRFGVLSKLVSIALGIPSPIILMSTSTWMQQLGSTSVSSCKLAEALVHDYFNLASNPKERLKSLPDIAPQFTANFLTAVAENYFTAKAEKVFPSKVLLETITQWVSENPNLCVAAQQRQAVLPPGAIAMEATTPIAGLLRWCILAPIYQQESALYSDLHLALLGSIAEIPRTTPPKAIYAQHLISCVSPLIFYFRDLKNKQEIKLDKILNDASLQLSLDRLAQAVQVAMNSSVLYGHLDDLFNHLQQLPYNKLLSIITSMHKQNKSIIIV